MAVKFEAQGWYSLLADKGDTSLIGRKTDGTPIPPMSGGYDKNKYCEKASTRLLNVIDIMAKQKNDYLPTQKKQKIYQGLSKQGLAFIPTGREHAVESDRIWNDPNVNNALYH